jgi:hypothetical protein
MLTATAFAQVSSVSFDPKCYQPTIGTPGVVDSIYGSYDGQELGLEIKNLWPEPGNSFGRLTISESTVITTTFPLYQTGPTFDLHHLHAIDTFKMWFDGYGPDRVFIRGHFRSQKYWDILYRYSSTSDDPLRIYWSDDQGNYDTSRYTLLEVKNQPGYKISYGEAQPYTAYMSSDSVEDIIAELKPYFVTSPDSVFFLYFKGGQRLKDQGSIAYADSMQFFDTIYEGTIYEFSHGDYRGVGREDLIGSSSIGDVMFYKNDPPFSLQNFVRALKYDTLMAKWQNPNYGSHLQSNEFSMRAFKKAPGDSSVDFMPAPNGWIYIYKGGPEFGSHRLLESEADFIIHSPSYYDTRFSFLGFPARLYDCGDMTGTGNRVLFAGGAIDGSFFGYFFFYVLGDVMDDKVDMFLGALGNNGDVNAVDTLTADGDNLQDVILGMSGYGKDNGNQSNGTVWVIHGSKKIPVKGSTVNEQGHYNTENISIYPNPVSDGRAMIDLSDVEPQELNITLWDLLGRKVYEDRIREQDKVTLRPLLLNSLQSGSYILKVNGKNFTKKMQLTVLK